MALADAVYESLKETRELSVPSRIEKIRCQDLSKLSFSRDWLLKNRPCIITNALKDWPALSTWHDSEYLKSRFGDAKVSINVTPNGWGDSLLRAGETTKTLLQNAGDSKSSSSCDYFVMPQEATVPLAAALDSLQSRSHEPLLPYIPLAPPGLTTKGPSSPLPNSALGCSSFIPYLSFQNDNLRQQLPSLEADILPLPFAPWDAAPEAVNVWIGDERSTSAIHKDHYENLYCVIQGAKIFTLFPPSDILWLYEREYDMAQYRCMSISSEAGGIKSTTAYTTKLDEGTSPAAASTAAASSSTAFMWGLETILNEAAATEGSTTESSAFATAAASNSSSSCVSASPPTSGPSPPSSPSSSCKKIPWISIDPSPSLRDEMVRKYPLYKNAHPLVVRVEAGETLYLPALWYHQVAQEGTTIAVNFWHDMDFSTPLWSHYSMCRSLAPLVQQAT